VVHGSVDYGAVVKNYRTGSKRGPDHRYDPPRDPFITKTPIFGAPDMTRLSTSFVERNNLTMRHVVGRTRRLCLPFSKTLRGHRAAEALGFMAYNFVRQNIALDGETPAMAAGLADHPWTIGEPARTVRRWLSWWQGAFLCTEVFVAVRARLVEVALPALPGG
jgi:hypothetical protein